jgi:hypothetical protein
VFTGEVGISIILIDSNSLLLRLLYIMPLAVEPCTYLSTPFIKALIASVGLVRKRFSKKTKKAKSGLVPCIT